MQTMSVPIPRRSINYKDIAYKVFWTAAAGALPTLVVVVQDLPAGWILPATLVVNYLTAMVRQRTGTTAPDLPPPTV